MRQLFPDDIRRRFASWPTWGAVTLIAAIACQTLLGAPPRGHDALLHYYRIPAISELWQNGIFFSRWAPDLIYGYGSPLFNFYPPLSAYLLTALYSFVGHNGPLAYSLSYAVALALTALSMFLLGRRLFGSTGGLLASAAYTWSPHVLLQTYSRGSLSNALALALAPLAAWAMLRVIARPMGRRVAFAALIVALMLASHTAAGLLFIPVLLLLALAAPRLLHDGDPPLRAGLVALLLGVALAAFIWLPALLEIGATRYAASVGPGSDFRDHFAAVFSWPPPLIAGLAKTPLPHSAGLTQLLLGAAAIPFALRSWWRQKRQRHARALAAFVALAGLLGLSVFFFTTPAATWFWEHVALLRQLQFPWRLLDLPVFLLALPVAWWATVLRDRWRPWLLGAAVALIFLNAAPYLYPARLLTLPRQPTLADATRAQQTYGIIGLTAWGEYSSDQIERWPGGPPFPGADRGAPLFEKLRLPQTVALRAARGGLLNATWELSVPAPAAATVSVHYFPGWSAQIDGDQASIQTDERGRMHIDLPAGLHELSLAWTRTPARWLADGLSLLSLLVFGWLAVSGRAIGARRAPQDGPFEVASHGGAWWPVLLLAVLLLLKVGVLDTIDTPLVVHPNEQYIPGVTRPAQGAFGPFRLLGYRMEEADQLALYWRAARQVGAAYSVRLTLSDANGLPLYEVKNDTPGDNPTTGWGPGLLVRDAYPLPLDDLPAPGAYRLSVAVLDPRTGDPLPVLDGPPGATTVGVGSVKRPPQPVTVPARAQAFDARFAGAVALTHAQVPQTVQRGDAFTITLFWASRAPVDRDYTVFVHLVRPNGEFIAAFDGQPHEGLYPTSFWEPGEVIVDARRLHLDVPPGDYLLRVGLYDLASGERLALGALHEGADGLVVGTVEVRP